MVSYNQKSKRNIGFGDIKLNSFVSDDESNLDESTVKSFGEEWDKFTGFDDLDLKVTGDQYFDIVNETMISDQSLALDVGCGSGRWSRYLSNKVCRIEAIDPNDAIVKAAKFNEDKTNIRWSQASVSNIPFDDNTFDFVFSLGVLHHIPDTEKALADAVKKLKPQGYFLLYLYYSLDNRGGIYKFLFYVSHLFRKVISSLPGIFKRLICDVIAVTVYLPLVLIARFLKKVGLTKLFRKFPLSYYHDKSFHIMRNDALDRFGTPLEQRFSKQQIKEMMERCGLTNIVFSENEPYWHAVGQKVNL